MPRRRPDDGPLQWPKHVVLLINTPLRYYLCFDCTTLYHLFVSNTAGMSQLKIVLKTLMQQHRDAHTLHNHTKVKGKDSLYRPGLVPGG